MLGGVALVGVFVVLLVLAVIGRFNLWPSPLPEPLVSGEVDQRECAGSAASTTRGELPRRLFVLVHGLQGDGEARWHGVCRALRPHGHLLVIRYPASPLSNADAETVAEGIARRVETILGAGDYQDVVLVGHSMGAITADD